MSTSEEAIKVFISMNRLKNNFVGIMAIKTGCGPFPFSNSTLYKQLCRSGQSAQLHVVIFSPDSIDLEKRCIIGYSYLAAKDQWMAAEHPIPGVIYDRCFCSTPQLYQLYRKMRTELKRLPGIRLLGNGLKGKWEVLKTLRQSAELRNFIPETRKLSSLVLLQQWLASKGEAILKPEYGSQGRGVLHVIGRTLPRPEYRIIGRDHNNTCLQRSFSSIRELLNWSGLFTSSRRYLLQERLRLATEDNVPFDVRTLIQKNERGLWSLTGIAIRCGKQGNVTANLHGGGHAVEPASFLIKRFGADKADLLLKQLSQLSEHVAFTLEASHGRLAELGIDFGIDTDGLIWILEANSKPGRAIFNQLSDVQSRHRSIDNPIRYARFMLEHAHDLPLQINQEGTQT